MIITGGTMAESQTYHKICRIFGTGLSSKSCNLCSNGSWQTLDSCQIYLRRYLEEKYNDKITIMGSTKEWTVMVIKMMM